MESAYPHVLCRRSGQLVNSFPHFSGGLIGEGNGEDTIGTDAFFKHIGYSNRQRSGFSGTRSGQYEDGPVLLLYRLLLHRIQLFKTNHIYFSHYFKNGTLSCLNFPFLKSLLFLSVLNLLRPFRRWPHISHCRDNPSHAVSGVSLCR